MSEIRAACGQEARKVSWLTPDLAVQTPPLGPEYGKHMAQRLVNCLGKLGEEGKLGAGDLVQY